MPAADRLTEVLEDCGSRLWRAEEIVGLGSLHTDCAGVDTGVAVNILGALALQLVEVLEGWLVFNFVANVQEEIDRSL